ncbi:mechanosensitive ion channel family protein [Pseudoalteromonas tunicata]|uniref:mechanosensitive ion channel family protein n=1 Tax=Pseudoalteromonas tunicata TaxID=314281 RepID=UPI003518FC11
MTMSQLTTILLEWFTPLKQALLFAQISATSIGIVSLLMLYLFAKQLFLPSIQKLVIYFSPTTAGRLSKLLDKFNGRLAIMLCCIVFIGTLELIYPFNDLILSVLRTFGQCAMLIYGGLIFSSIISISGGIYNQLSFAKDVPIQGLIQLVKLVTFIVICVLLVSLMLDKSPAYILSGFGALAAVLLLVFKDTILGFVASIQIAANRLVTHGDWIQMDQYGADGEVEDLGLNIVKVRNWDKTITSIPTYALIAQSFKNWRGMQESGGRRIKRALNIDMHSVRLLEAETVQSLQQHPVLKSYFDKNTEDLSSFTNISVFRRYAEFYLKVHPQLNHGMTLMVRELQPTATGLPIEFYCFSEDQRWIPYEHLQADITDHFLAVLPLFKLYPYQHISGALSTQSGQ